MPMMKKYQAGGSVSAPERKRAGMGGSRKNVPVMTPEQSRAARESMTPEERREADAPLTAEELRRMSRYKKGGMVKKKAGGVVKKAMGGMISKGCK